MNPEAPSVLARAIEDLSHGLAMGPKADGLLQAAQLTVSSALTALKEGDTGGTIQLLLASRMEKLDFTAELGQIGAQAAEAEQQLRTLQAETAPDALISTLANRSSLSHRLIQLSESRLHMLVTDEVLGQQPTSAATGGREGGSGTAASDAAAQNKLGEDKAASHAIHSIRELASQIGQWQGSSNGAAWPASPKVLSKEGKRQQEEGRLPELQREANLLGAQDLELQVQIGAALREVERLQAARAALEARRQVVISQLEVCAQGAAVVDPEDDIAPAVPPPGNSPEEKAQLWRATQLGVLHTLESLLLRPLKGVGGEVIGRRDTEEVVCRVICGAVMDHLQALASYLAHKQQEMHEAGRRLHDSQSWLASTEASLKQLRAQGHLQMAKELEKPRDSRRLITQNCLRQVEAVMADANSVKDAMQRPVLRTAVALLPPLPNVHTLLNQIGLVLHQIKGEYTAVSTGGGTAAAGAAHAVPDNKSAAVPHNGNGHSGGNTRSGRGGGKGQQQSRERAHGAANGNARNVPGGNSASRSQSRRGGEQVQGERAQGETARSGHLHVGDESSAGTSGEDISGIGADGKQENGQSDAKAGNIGRPGRTQKEQAAKTGPVVRRGWKPIAAPTRGPDQIDGSGLEGDARPGLQHPQQAHTHGGSDAAAAVAAATAAVSGLGIHKDRASS
eukprot:TRINITY_DN11939_c0_g1_i1.p1 TRINITY_DN11939_c0_g1~~TRINITY_DN11939_c0_g1_i1.p1  ORF type:complete len:678 (-),score=171.84 TRINITY_DN11939_c0_g1_i1:601-2634(-)